LKFEDNGCNEVLYVSCYIPADLKLYQHRHENI